MGPARRIGGVRLLIWSVMNFDDFLLAIVWVGFFCGWEIKWMLRELRALPSTCNSRNRREVAVRRCSPRRLPAGRPRALPGRFLDGADLAFRRDRQPHGEHCPPGELGISFGLAQPSTFPLRHLRGAPGPPFPSDASGIGMGSLLRPPGKLRKRRSPDEVPGS